MTVVQTQTLRLDLDEPSDSDLDELYAICSDARSWTHFPSLRHIDPAVTERMLRSWFEQWRRNSLGTWIARKRNSRNIIGYGGCSTRQGIFWNLGYRLQTAAQGHGYATEICTAAIAAATDLEPALPIVAYLLEHNVASARVAERIGFTLAGSAPDYGNPDPDAVRLVYSDRPLTDEQLRAVFGT